jgi:hypothetical protein
MNVSHRFKLVWWATSRCASRYTSGILSPLVFYNYDEDARPIYGSNLLLDTIDPSKTVSFSHIIQTPSEFKDYDVIANIRNPYDTFYSNYRLEALEYLRGSRQTLGIYDIPNVSEIEYTFEEWANRKFTYLENAGWTLTNDRYELHNRDEITYLVRYENLNEDLMNIPHVRDLYNSNDRYRSYVDFIKEENNTGYRSSLAFESERFTDVYTEEIANKVYNLYKLQFDLFGYDRDSWKNK